MKNKNIFIYTVLCSLIALCITYYFVTNNSSDNDADSIASLPSLPLDTSTTEMETTLVIEHKPSNQAEEFEGTVIYDDAAVYQLSFTELKNSPYASDNALAALRTDTFAEREELLLLAYAKEPNNVLVNYLMLKRCARDQTSTLCGLPVIDTLLQEDGDNQSTMTDAAILAFNLGDATKALSLLQKAAAATKNDDFYKRILESSDDALARQNLDRNFMNQVRSNIVATANGYTSYEKLLPICKQQAPSSPAWMSACKEIGSSLAKYATNDLDHRTALILEATYSGLSEREIAQALDSVNKILAEEAVQSPPLMARLTEEQRTKTISDEAWEQYLAVYSSQGLNAAREYLYQYLTE